MNEVTEERVHYALLLRLKYLNKGNKFKLEEHEILKGHSRTHFISEVKRRDPELVVEVMARVRLGLPNE